MSCLTRVLSASRYRFRYSDAPKRLSGPTFSTCAAPGAAEEEKIAQWMRMSLGVRSVARTTSSRNCRTRITRGPSRNLMPGEPLRPDPGWPETWGGTPINKKVRR